MFRFVALGGWVATPDSLHPQPWAPSHLRESIKSREGVFCGGFWVVGLRDVDRHAGLGHDQERRVLHGRQPQDRGSGLLRLGFRVWGLEVGAQGLGFGVDGIGYRVWGLGFKV